VRFYYHRNIGDRNPAGNFRETWESGCTLFIVHRFTFTCPLLTDLPFYKKHPKLTGAALGITGTVLLAPIAVVGVLGAVGFTSAGVAAGNSILFPPKEI